MDDEQRKDAWSTWSTRWHSLYGSTDAAIESAMTWARCVANARDTGTDQSTLAHYRAKRDRPVEALAHATELGLLPFPNTGTIRKTFDWVQGQAELARIEADGIGQPIWDQGTWRTIRTRETFDAELDEFVVKSCGTAMCFAGHVCDTAGVEWSDCAGDSSIEVTQELLDQYPQWGDKGLYKVGDRADVATVATLTMNIHPLEGQYLYAGGNDVEVITAFVDVIFARAGEQLQLV